MVSRAAPIPPQPRDRGSARSCYRASTHADVRRPDGGPIRSAARRPARAVRAGRSRLSARSGLDAGSSATSCRRTSRRRAPTPLLGNLWWVLDPLLQMLVYVVLVSVIFERKPAGLPAVHLRRDPALEMVHDRGLGRDHVRGRPGPADQADPVPQARPAHVGHRRRDRQLRVRADPAGRLLLVLLFRDRISPYLVFIPIIAVVQLVFTLAITVVSRRRQRLLSRHRQRQPATPCGCGSICRPACTASTARRARPSRTIPSSSRSSSRTRSTTLFNAYRAVIYGSSRPADRSSRLVGAGRAVPRLAAAAHRQHLCSNASNPRSPRSCEVPMTATRGRRRPCRPMSPSHAQGARRSATTCASRARRRCARLQQTVRRQSGEREFWALRDVAFRLVHGESLAVIGPERGRQEHAPPGAGRDHHAVGRARSRSAARSRACSTLGAGFDQELTGRDNILLAGAFMGIEPAEMKARLEDIIAFAGHRGVHRRAAANVLPGMRARLGFRIATSVDPDVLLLDEVLATGDQVFRAQEPRRASSSSSAAKAIVLVTHDMNWVTSSATGRCSWSMAGSSPRASRATSCGSIGSTRPSRAPSARRR